MTHAHGVVLIIRVLHAARGLSLMHIFCQEKQVKTQTLIVVKRLERKVQTPKSFSSLIFPGLIPCEVFFVCACVWHISWVFYVASCWRGEKVGGVLRWARKRGSCVEMQLSLWMTVCSDTAVGGWQTVQLIRPTLHTHRRRHASTFTVPLPHQASINTYIHTLCQCCVYLHFTISVCL